MEYTTGMQPDSMRALALAFTKWVGSLQSLAVHTVFFAGSFLAVIFGFLQFEQMLLILTTIVSLEAIYLAIFIQMTINLQSEHIQEVSADVEEIQEDIDEIQEDVEEISEDVGEIQEDVDELQENVEEISEDVEEMSEEDQKKAQNHAIRSETLSAIQNDLRKLMADIEELRKQD